MASLALVMRALKFESQMLLGKCRSLESLTVSFSEFEESSLGDCPSHLLRSLSLRRLVIAGDYMTPDFVHNIARLKDFSKNDNRPIRVCDKEEELDLPPY